MIVWMGLALMVSTRLWLAGVVSPTRETKLADRLMQQVRACGQALRAVLVCTDGWAAYPNSIRRAFRETVKLTSGRGRARLRVWPQLYIGTVIKCTVKKRVVEITRQMAQGSLKRAAVLLRRSEGGTMLNTAFIERFNGTMRERLATLTRKCRHAARRLEALHTGMYPASLYIQFLLAASGTGQAARRAGLHSSNGGWTHRPCLESVGTPGLQSGSRSVGRTQTTRAASHSTAS
jgi:IS1 family transposase